MQYMGLNEIREKFLSFYESKGHLRLPSFPLVPQNDKSLLLINAGMAPLKPYFLGQETPPRERVTTCQKCIRTPDIESVGKTARHGTYFEMLGNFSFGDYFKHEATKWAWEFATEVMELPVDKLWVTIYLDDDEAFDIWTKEVGVSPDRIVRMGKEDNFWEIGTGPCGPCSELHFDRGEAAGCGKPDCKLGCDCDRYVEFWNLVFTQFDKDEDGNYNRLAKPNIDTGMGLERLACIMQGVNNIFEVDTVKNIMGKVIEIAGVNYGDDYKTDVSLRVITDHIRSTTFMISDGVQISNEGRGYVLRRLLRRAARHGKLLGIEEPFLYKVCQTVIDENANAYPELVDKADYIKKMIELEEIRFSKTINDGLSILNGHIDTLTKEGKDTLSGEDAFKLSDTYGFPIDLTVEILEEKGLKVDRDAFDKCLTEQKVRARENRLGAGDFAWKDELLDAIKGISNTEFVGYEGLTNDAKVLGIFYDGDLQSAADDEVGEVMLLLDKTSFYGESGGQTGDRGTILADGVKIKVNDCKKMGDGKFVHACEIVEGIIKVGDSVKCEVCGKRRAYTEKNHSATHLLQKALRTVLGDHVEQAGSYVNNERLRFDFSHFEALTKEQITEVEKIVNESIQASYEVDCSFMPIDDAKKLGAMALFGEKYGNIVRVVKMGDYSVELCGGTHVKNTGNIGAFKILSEAGIAAGVRRIEAITGQNVINYIYEKENVIDEVSAALKAAPTEAVNKVNSLYAELKAAQAELSALKAKAAASSLDDMASDATDINGVKVIATAIDVADINTLRNMGDAMKDKIENSVGLFITSGEGKVTMLCVASKSAVEKGVHCGKIVKELSALVGGNGGGKPDSAQAGGKDASGIKAATEKIYELVKEQIG